MLCQFSFKNFKSYKETTTFDFQATSSSGVFRIVVKKRESRCTSSRRGYIWSEWWGKNQSVTSSFMFDFYSG